MTEARSKFLTKKLREGKLSKANYVRLMLQDIPEDGVITCMFGGRLVTIVADSDMPDRCNGGYALAPLDTDPRGFGL